MVHWTTSGRAYVGAYSAPLRTTTDPSGSPQAAQAASGAQRAAQGSLGQPRAAQKGVGRAEGRGGNRAPQRAPCEGSGGRGLTSQRRRIRDRSHGLCSHAHGAPRSALAASEDEPRPLALHPRAIHRIEGSLESCVRRQDRHRYAWLCSWYQAPNATLMAAIAVTNKYAKCAASRAWLAGSRRSLMSADMVRCPM